MSSKNLFEVYRLIWIVSNESLEGKSTIISLSIRKQIFLKKIKKLGREISVSAYLIEQRSN
jgi:hypothetical protein